MCLGLKLIIIPQFPLHPVDALLQVATVDNSSRFQIGPGLLDFLYMRFPLGHHHTSKHEKSPAGCAPARLSQFCSAERIIT